MTFDFSRFYFIYSAIGPVGLVLIGVAFFAFYIAVWQCIYVHHVWRNFKRGFLDIQRDEGRCLKDIQPEKANPLIRIIYDIIKTHAQHSNDIRAEVGYLFYRNFKCVTNGLCYLKLIAVISPLLGLLGTVWGMIQVFQNLGGVAKANASLLSSGISSALLTTAMGLSIAIPILWVYYYLTLKYKAFYIEAIEHSYSALEIYRRQKNKG